MKIGILTYHFSDNFGALLQGYALRKWFINHGHDASFVNYHPSYVEEGGNFVSLLNPHHFRKNLKILYLKLSSLKRRWFGNAEQAKRFQAFRESDLGVTGKRLHTFEDIAASSLDYDLLVAGSDQIWNPSEQKGLDPAYFLAFASNSATRKISYAASFGRGSLDIAYHDQAKFLLKNLDGISVREMSGVEIVRAVAGCDAACVPDPTLLLESYSDLLNSSNEDREGHIFCYALRSSQGIREVAQLASTVMKAKIFSPYNAHRRWKEIGYTVYPCPKGWLALINNASFVVTNSFHGTALSVILKRPFLVVGLSGTKQELNERSKNLLNQLGLINRFVDAGDLHTAKQRLLDPIDWDEVSNRLKSQRLIGEAYLESELARVGQL